MKKFFQAIWSGWKWFAHKLGIVNTHILLTVSYFIMIGIAFVVTKLFGRDLLDRRMRPAETYWHAHEDIAPTVASAKRQF